MKTKLLRGTIACLMASIFAVSAFSPLRAKHISAEENDSSQIVTTLDDDTFYYVAIGDSITSGFGIDDAETSVNAAFTVGENYLNSPKECYPAVLADKIKNTLTQNGYFEDDKHKFDWSNLGAPGFMTVDFLNTILNPDYVSEFWNMFPFFYPGSESMLEYTKAHKYYIQEIAKADLITIHVGSNDLMVRFIYDLLADYLSQSAPSNLLLIYAATLYSMLISGLDINTLTTYLNIYFTSDIATIEKDVNDILQYLTPSKIKERMLKYSKDAMADYRNLVKAIQYINPNAQIAFVGYFDLFGNSYECDGVSYDLAGTLNQVMSYISNSITLKDIINKNHKIVKPNVTSLDNASLLAETSEYYPILRKAASEIIKDIISKNKELFSSPLAFAELFATTLNPANIALTLTKLALVSDEKKYEIFTGLVPVVGYTFTYTFVGEPVLPAFCAMNEELKQIAREFNSPYVNIFDIANENNTNPHPLTAGHKYIADQIFDQICLDPLSAISDSTSSCFKVTSVKQAILGDNVTFNVTSTKNDPLFEIKVNGKVIEHENGTFTVKSFNSNTKIEIISSDHNYNDGVVIKRPTYLKTGVIRYTCSDCGSYFDKPIAKLSVINTIGNIIKSIFPFSNV